MASGRFGFTTRASCLVAAGATAFACGLLLGIVDLARAGVLALAVPVLASVVVLRSQLLIANRREIEPRRGVAGSSAVVHLTITNRSVMPTGTLMLEDRLPRQMRGDARFVIEGLLSRETRTVSYRMPRLARGRYRTGPLTIRLTDPFHLIDVRRSFTASTELVVAPVMEPIGGARPPRSLDVGDDVGSHSIGTHGADDASTREYRTGDDLRKIHWRSSARTGALMVRQEERPWQGRLTVLLDPRAVAHDEHEPTGDDVDARTASSLEWAISAAASLVGYALAAGRDVGLIDDPARPEVVSLLDSTQIGDRLAGTTTSSAATLDALGGLLSSLARESTVLAVLGELDRHSLRMLAGLRPGGGTSGSALALVLDTATWGERHRTDAAVGDGRAGASARALRAAGWQVQVVRRGDSVAGAVQSLLRSPGGATSEPTGVLR